MIGGVGVGGWLALLLGRFRLDVSDCLLEWDNLMRCIAPRSEAEVQRRRQSSESLYDARALRKRVREMTELYGTGTKLVENDPKAAVISKYVFVATEQKSEPEQYSLFRSYDKFDDDVRKNLLPGAASPSSYLIEKAFCVTGAERYFSEPWKEVVAGVGECSFQDQREYKPHNITALALNEVWSLFGKGVDMSVVVNVGPGLVNEADLKPITKSFSWGLKSSRPSPQRTAQLLHSEDPSQPLDVSPSNTARTVSVNSFGSNTATTPAAKAGFSERELENHILSKLRHVYGEEGRPPYYRLGPKISAAGTRWNDTILQQLATVSTEDHITSLEYQEVQKGVREHFKDPLPALSQEC